MGPSTGLEASVTARVTDADTAAALGSGDVPALGTPRLLALAEAATVQALTGHLAPGDTSVGTRVQIEHVGAAGVGAEVTVQARLAHVDGRILRFEVLAHGADDRLLAHGQVTRMLVERRRFVARLDDPVG